MIEVAAQPEKYHLTIDDVERMVKADILSSDARLELIRGELLTMTPIGKKHALIVTYLSNKLSEVLGNQCVIYAQNPLELSPNSAPEPDIAILEGSMNRYQDRLPQASDVQLLIEVADSSLKYDRETKLPLYAEAGIPEVWIVNLNEDVLELYRQPKGKFYGQKLVLLPDETASPLAFPDVSLDWQL